MNDLSRYSRQILFAPLGQEGQAQLLSARAVLIGCGALGSVLANSLVRAGVGRLRIIDRDLIETHNLHRQMLFDEDDVRADLPKAEAAARKLRRINSEVIIEPIVDDVNHRNITEFAVGADLLLDATDNFETRFLINDIAVRTRCPWIYGACVGSTGMSMVIVPGETPCLRCIFEEPPPPELNPTCETAGILGPVVALVASHQAMEAIKILAGRRDAVDRRLLTFDAWSGRFSHINVLKAQTEGECPCCKGARYEYLEGRFSGRSVTLCGRNAVQIYPGRPMALDFATLADRLRPIARAEPRFNPLLLKVLIDDYELTVFGDGRALIKGTTRPEEARTVYARYIGS